MKSKIQRIYKALLDAYGPQGWWPVTVNPKKGPEYFPGDYSHPRNAGEAWEVIVGAILTQNTSWKNVEKAILNLIENNCLDIDCIMKTNAKALAVWIRPSGYYNQKAKRLKTLARYMKRVWDGKLGAFFDRPVEEIRKELLSIKGIGRETADSILLYAGKKPIFVVDAYTRRVFNRLGLIDEKADYDEIRCIVENAFFDKPEDEQRTTFNEFHALLVEHAKRHCRKKPACEGCPIRRTCKASFES